MTLNQKNILVTGARGFVGSAVLARLAAQGVPKQNIVAHSQEIGDLRSIEECRKAVHGVHIVIHLAGITGGVAFHREHAERIYEENLAMGLNIIAAARKSGAEKFVMAGSLTEYGIHAPLPLREETLWDGEPKPAHAAYARAKRALLTEAGKLRSKGLQSAHLLLASMYGPGEKSDFVIPALIQKMIAARDSKLPNVTVMGTGNDTRDFLYVDDAAEAIVMAAGTHDSAEPMNIASGKETSIRDLAFTIGRLIGYEGKIVFEAKRKEVSRSWADISRAKKELGWSPATDLETGLRATIEWHAGSAI